MIVERCPGEKPSEDSPGCEEYFVVRCDLCGECWEVGPKSEELESNRHVCAECEKGGGVEMNDNMLRWLLTGDVGASSKAMAAHLCGFTCSGCSPSDPGDFARCLMLLDAVPEARAELHRMAEVSVVWAALVARWSEIEATFRDEQLRPGVFYSAPKTYKIMNEIINKADNAGKEGGE